MAEIISILMACFFTVVYFVQKKKGSVKKSVNTTLLLFWGASLMWLVDCVVSAIQGEGFFDFSKEDLILGIIIAAAGMLVFGIINVVESLKKKN